MFLFSLFGNDEVKQKPKKKRNLLRSSNEYVNEIADIYSNCVDKKKARLYATEEVNKILDEQRLEGFLIRDSDNNDERYVVLRKNFIEVMSDLKKTNNGYYTVFVDNVENTRGLLVRMDAAQISQDMFFSSKLGIVVIEDCCWECVL